MIDFDPSTLLNPRALRNAFGTYLTGVTVVTAMDADGAPLGFTANSFASVSLDPPLVLVCLANSSGNFDTFANAGGFGVNILSEAQIEVSNTFARPVEDRFSTVGWDVGPHGAPILNDVSAWFDCAMHKTVEAGDHLIMIGEVKAFDHNVSPGLGYARGAYVTPAAEAEVLSRRATMAVSALIARDGEVLLVDRGDGGVSVPTTTDLSEGTNGALTKLIADTGIKAEPGFVYSVFDDAASKLQHISFLCQAAEGAPAKGKFVKITRDNLADVEDPAICAMLERFADESLLGNFGTYYGNEVSGEVRPLVERSDAV